jgi:predicted aspartyl protease
MIRHHVHLLALLPVLATGCSQMGDLLKPDAPAPEPEVRVEMRVAHGLPLVEGRLPGDARAWFLIDTGAGDFTLLDEELSRALKLKHDLVRDPLLPSVNFSAKLPFLEVDGMGRRDLEVYVTDAIANRGELSDLGVRVQGVLGTGYFRGRCLWLDWGKGEFTASRERGRTARQVPVPLRFGVGGDLRATVRVNGMQAEALIDTGSGQTLVTRELAEAAHVTFDLAKVALHQETSIGPAAVREGVVDRITLASVEAAKIPVLVIERRLPNADLVIGTDVLSRYGVTLDLGEPAYLVLDPAEGAATP